MVIVDPRHWRKVILSRFLLRPYRVAFLTPGRKWATWFCIAFAYRVGGAEFENGNKQVHWQQNQQSSLTLTTSSRSYRACMSPGYSVFPPSSTPYTQVFLLAVFGRSPNMSRDGGRSIVMMDLKEWIWQVSVAFILKLRNMHLCAFENTSFSFEAFGGLTAILGCGAVGGIKELSSASPPGKI